MEVKLLKEVVEFIRELDPAAQKAILKSVDRVQNNIVRKEFFKKLPGTDDIWEFRALSRGVFIRLLAFYDKRKESFIVAVSGFLKKTNKTPKSEIKKAEDLKKKYFEEE